MISIFYRKKHIFLILLILFSLFFCRIKAEAKTIGSIENLLSQVGATSSQCDLGSMTSDAVRAAAGTDFAMIPGGILYQNLQPGEVTLESLESSYVSDAELGICEVSTAELKELLETGLSHIQVDTDNGDVLDEEASSFYGFLQISGFSLKCDYSAPVGERVLWIKDEAGNELNLSDTERKYSLALTTDLLDEKYGFTLLQEPQKLDCSMIEAVSTYIAEGKAEAEQSERYKIIGIRREGIMLNISPIIPLLLTAVFIIAGIRSTGRARKAEEEMKYIAY
jgi:hypothetical protein